MISVVVPPGPVDLSRLLTRQLTESLIPQYQSPPKGQANGNILTFTSVAGIAYDIA
jgi:hypothetical protein